MKRLAAALLLLVAAGSAAAQQTINLRDADIRAYIQDVARATGRTFIIDPRVNGKVSVVSERPLSQSQYFELFLSTLRANGMVVTPAAGGAFRIAPAEGAATQPGGGQGRDRFATQVFRLDSIDAASAVETLRPLVSRDGAVTANRSGNAVIVADYADNLARIAELVRRIDRDRQVSRVVPLKNAGAREIAAALAQLGSSGGTGGEGRQIAIVPVDSANAVALRGEPQAVARLAATIAELDARAAAGAEVRVIFLAHADAEKLLPVLQQLVGQAPSAVPQAPGFTTSMGSGSNRSAPTAGGQFGTDTAAPASAPGGGSGAGLIPQATIGRGRAVIVRYEGANALVIAAPADVQRQLGEVVRQLDTRRDQVLVEAIIVEISDVAAQKLGVQFLLTGTNGSTVPFASTNYSNAAPNLLSIAGAAAAEKRYGKESETAQALRDAAVTSLLGATGGTFGGGGKLTNDTLFGFVLNAVRSDTASNVLSTPSVMTLDNAQARILVGQDVPLTTGEALSNNFDNAFRTIQRQNVGIQLDVRPQINAGGTIKLTLRQEVSSIAGPVSSNSPELILNKREIATTVTVDDGEIIALGGLLDENERRTLEKTPLLGDIPGLGNLFRSRSRNRTKTNLMVFIRPRIIRSAADARAIAADRYDYIRADAALRQGLDSLSLDDLVADYLKAAPPERPPPPPPP